MADGGQHVAERDLVGPDGRGDEREDEQLPDPSGTPDTDDPDGDDPGVTPQGGAEGGALAETGSDAPTGALALGAGALAAAGAAALFATRRLRQRTVGDDA
ncbi:hypothetical protein ACTWP5_07030 [Streptomyces sp. 4N509B]|uniref:hypothetical protein n=1 Tax=Streptomyces sp. 4N509B TaxID=3457413 RepID=UPI003FD599C5